MRKSNLILILAGAALAAISCDGLQGAGDPIGPYTISVDKTTIEADGFDAATLTIKDANGLVLTDEHIKDCSFHILESDTYITRKTNTFTAIDNGTYTIEGMYLGKPCENTVSVTAANRSKYEVFSKKVAIYRLTSVECPNCPSMTASLASVDDFTKNHTIIMAFHGIVSSYDPYCLYDGNKNIIASILCNEYGLPGYPSAIYSLSTGSEKRTRTDIMEFVMSELINFPATSGIKATSTVKDGKVTINASVKVSKDGKYDIGCAIVQNGLDGGSESYEDVYNNVVRNISTNYRYMSKNAFTLKNGEEKTGLVYEDIPFDSEHQSDCNIVLFTLVPQGNAARIDNVVSFPVGGSVEYIYNK